MFHGAIKRIGELYDRIDSEPNHQRLDKVVVSLSVAGFFLHLMLIFWVRWNPEFETGVLSGIGKNYLHAVYTPFSFILFYEVLLLVLALPNSLTSSIGKQYEIISLIVVRRVFKDIGAFEDVESWLAQTDAMKLVFLDMGGALLMFLTVAAFYRLRQTVVSAFAPRDLEGFILMKKAIALFLGAVLVVLATHDLAIWLLTSFSIEHPLVVGPADIDNFFFPSFFVFMIFTDVFLLIISISYYERYEHVFRNAGFVISTVLLRVSLSTKQPYDIGIALFAMIYGLSVIAVFAYFTRVLTNEHKVELEKSVE